MPTAATGSRPGVASASRSKHTTATITPAAKLKSRLTIRLESRRNRQAAVPPSPVPPMPAAAVTKSTCPNAPIPFPPY